MKAKLERLTWILRKKMRRSFGRILEEKKKKSAVFLCAGFEKQEHRQFHCIHDEFNSQGGAEELGLACVADKLGGKHKSARPSRCGREE